MSMSLCFNPGEDPECSSQIKIFENANLPILPCSWTEGFVDPGKYSLLSVLANYNSYNLSYLFLKLL